MAVEGDFDVGAIYSHTEIPVGPRETVVQLKERLVGEGVKLLKATLSEGLKTPIPQIGQPTWAQKITVADRELDWTRPAVALDRLVRIGGAWTLIRGGRLKVLVAEPTIDVVEGPLGLLVKDQVITGEGALRLIEVQAQDRSRQTFDAWRAGARLQSETRLGE
jgi:methionyl-tRNA formyltransferase